MVHSILDPQHNHGITYTPLGIYYGTVVVQLIVIVYIASLIQLAEMKGMQRYQHIKITDMY